MHRAIIGLVFEGQLVDMVANDAQGEDGECEEVASIVRVVTEDTSQEVIPIFYKTIPSVSWYEPSYTEHEQPLTELRAVIRRLWCVGK